MIEYGFALAQLQESSTDDSQDYSNFVKRENTQKRSPRGLGSAIAQVGGVVAFVTLASTPQVVEPKTSEAAPLRATCQASTIFYGESGYKLTSEYSGKTQTDQISSPVQKVNYSGECVGNGLTISLSSDAHPTAPKKTYSLPAGDTYCIPVGADALRYRPSECPVSAIGGRVDRGPEPTPTRTPNPAPTARPIPTETPTPRPIGQVIHEVGDASWRWVFDDWGLTARTILGPTLATGVVVAAVAGSLAMLLWAYHTLRD
jgi:hypothetical protein